MKKDAFYFQHDYNASTDIKCLFLRQALGMEGYGIYWFLVEQLANSGGYLPLSITPVLAMQIQVTEIKVQSVIRNFQLFTIDTENNFFSRRLNEHLEIRKALSESGKRGALNRWNKIEDSHPIGDPISDPNAKERKGKEKEKNYIYSDFYDSQIENCQNEKYIQFVKYLFGNNMLKLPLSGVLSIKNQLTLSEFEIIIKKCTTNKKKLGDILTKIENDVKYYKGKKSLYRTLLNWSEDRFIS